MRWGEAMTAINDFEKAFLSALKISRSDIFGVPDSQIPASAQADSQIPQLGYIGRNYAEGGVVILAINPGGGHDSYIRTAQDSVLLPMITALRDGRGDRETLHKMFEQYQTNIRSWNLWRIMAPVLEAAGKPQDEVAYLNWCPFRTRHDRMPRAQAMRNSYALVAKPLLDILRPQLVVGLGKKVGDWLARYHIDGARSFVVPRTNGDRYIRPEAREVLDEIARYARSQR